MDEMEKTTLPDEVETTEPIADLIGLDAPTEKPVRKKKKRWWVILLIVLGSLLLVGLLLIQCAWWWLHRTIDQNVQKAPEYTKEEVAVTPDEDIVQDIVDSVPDLKPEEIDKIEEKVSNVKNIALFGVDQESGSVGRSDTMIILSIDRDNGKIKMTSLARDSLVPIEGHGEEKLTHSWAYGHAKLALKTINQAFGMNITDYVYVNFEEFVKVIDYLGGVVVDVNQLELEAINYTTDQSKKLSGTGKQRLTGEQALIYARCRKDSDKNRTARQREVLIAMYEQVRKQPVSKLPETLKKVLKLCHTTLSADEIMDIAKWAVLESPTIESLSMPNSQLKPWQGVLDRAHGWVYVYDLDAAKKVLYSFIYDVNAKVSGVTQYVPSTTTAEATTTTTASDATTTSSATGMSVTATPTATSPPTTSTTEAVGPTTAVTETTTTATESTTESSAADTTATISTMSTDTAAVTETTTVTTP